jgi:hypothetical protein
VLVSGTKACQEDYDFASQANVPGTGTPASSQTPTPTTTATITPTGSITPVGTGTATATPTGTDAADSGDEETQQVGAGDDLFNELSALSESKSGSGATGAGAAAVAGAKGQNWLGSAFSKDSEAWTDSDGDGFSDAMEEEHQSDPRSATSAPKLESNTKLEDRIRQQEVEQEADRLGDEARSAGDEEEESDTDGDGVPNGVEEQRGMNPGAADSDQDGVRDDRELVLGTNPLKVDSDADGVSDMREYTSGTDPTIPETK